MTRLTLLGQAPEDLPAISALLQDATLRVPDIAHDSRRRRLVLLVNRYRWESPQPSRVRAAVRIDTVLGVQHRHWPPAPDAVLALLGLTHADDRLTLAFAAGTMLRVRAEAIDVRLEDLADPWPARSRPDHP